MKKTKYIPRVYFLPEHITDIAQDFKMRIDEETRDNLGSIMSVHLPDESWDHEQEAEFFSDIRKRDASYSYRLLTGPYDLIIDCDVRSARVVVATPQRKDVEGVFQIIERIASAIMRPIPEDEIEESKITIFIGHGQNPQWRDLKDHLHEQHGYSVQAYEIGARAGHEIRDILEEMLESSSIAFLIMTGEDETADGKLRARQNVIHEIGLFQGRLGFSRAIILLEEGVEEFSNIHGVQQIRFDKGLIRETFGDVVATIKREFPENTEG
jgi:predicted nucleotide-binding protein